LAEKRVRQSIEDMFRDMDLDTQREMQERNEYE